ncbi:MAG TPA: MAPEG family protein [Pseudomonadales bacterium]|nr:MAPEG family protein [Pseudomonadales bacterium]
MTLAYWCVLVAALMPIVFAGIAKSAPGYDNRDPRAWLAQREGMHARANAAQLNCHEAFPPFAAAVVIAHLAGGAEQGTLDALAGSWLLLRVAYGVAYLTDRDLLRSLLWTAALGVVIALFVVAA